MQSDFCLLTCPPVCPQSSRRARSKVSAASTAAATTAAAAASAAAAAGSMAASAAAAAPRAATGRPAAWAAASPPALRTRSGPPPSFRRWVAAAGRTRQRSNAAADRDNACGGRCCTGQQPSAKLSTATCACARHRSCLDVCAPAVSVLLCCIGCAAGTGGWPAGSGAGRLPAAVGVQRAAQCRSLPLSECRCTRAGSNMCVLSSAVCCATHAHTVACPCVSFGSSPAFPPHVLTRHASGARPHTHMSECTAATMSQLQNMAVVLTMCCRAAGCPAGLSWVW